MYLDEGEPRFPSVTHILNVTKSKESRDALRTWRERVGHNEAARITKQSADTGKAVHTVMESILTGREPDDNVLHVVDIASAMLAELDGLKFQPMGCEISLRNEIAHGITDLIALTGDDAKLTIIDYKTTANIKKREWIEDYIIQCAAYADMLNDMLGTALVKRLAIVMSDYKGNAVTFVVEGDELESYLAKWFDRVHIYYFQ